ncbi:hypothetical protein LCGC14_3052690, partial [marine sediment metagenome]
MDAYEKAVSHYKKALKIKGDFAEAHYNLGTALFKKGKFGKAVRSWSEALRLKPNWV